MVEVCPITLALERPKNFGNKACQSYTGLTQCLYKDRIHVMLSFLHHNQCSVCAVVES
jgi:hypothetical protein